MYSKTFSICVFLLFVLNTFVRETLIVKGFLEEYVRLRGLPD